MDAQYDDAARMQVDGLAPTVLDRLVAQAKAAGESTITLNLTDPSGALTFRKMPPVLDITRIDPEPVALTTTVVSTQIAPGGGNIANSLNGTSASDFSTVKVNRETVAELAENGNTLTFTDGPNAPPEEVEIPVGDGKIVRHPEHGFIHLQPRETVEEAVGRLRQDTSTESNEDLLARLKDLETKVGHLFGQQSPRFPAHEFRIGPGHRVAPGTEEQEITVRDVQAIASKVVMPVQTPVAVEIKPEEVVAKHDDSFRILTAFRQVHKAALTKGAETTEDVKTLENMVLSFKRHYHEFLSKTGTAFLVDFVLRHQNQLVNHRKQFLPVNGRTYVADNFDRTEFEQFQLVNNLLIMFLYQHTDSSNKLPDNTGFECFVALHALTEQFEEHKRETEKLRQGVALGVTAIIEATSSVGDPFAAMR